MGARPTLAPPFPGARRAPLVTPGTAPRSGWGFRRVSEIIAATPVGCRRQVGARPGPERSRPSHTIATIDLATERKPAGL